MTVIDSLTLWLGNGLLLAGAFFALTGAVGIIRMPDFFSRLHPAAVTDSLAILCILAGLMLHTGLTLFTGKLFLLMLFLLLTSPSACYALAKAAFLSGMVDDTIAKLKKVEQGEAVPNTIGEQETLASGEPMEDEQ